MNTNVLGVNNITYEIMKSYSKDGFIINIITPDITDTERKKSDILIKGKLNDLLNKVNM